jgi:hypothetical protein
MEFAPRICKNFDCGAGTPEKSGAGSGWGTMRAGLSGFGMRFGVPAALLSFACLLIASHANADVIAIGDDGAVTLHSGPALYMTADMRPTPIAPLRTEIAPARPMRAASADIRVAIAQAAQRHGLSPLLVGAVAWRESAFDPQAVSRKGARGVMQLMPDTARRYCGADCSAAANIEAGTGYLASLLARYDNDLAKALAAYNAGPKAVDRFGGLPPYRETEDYVTAIFARMAGNALAGPN